MAKTVEELNARKEEIGKRIDAIVAERVEATLNGKAFNANAELAELNSEYLIIGEALPVAREREAAEEARLAAEARARHIQDQRDELTDKEKERLAEVRKAEKAVDALVQSFSQIFRLGTEQIALFAALKYPDRHLDIQQMESRLADRLTRKLSRIFSPWGSRRSQLGRLQWMPEAQRDEDWVEEEKQELLRQIETLFRILDRDKS
jgi:hypothetical protein